jgi:hypothetical protein
MSAPPPIVVKYKTEWKESRGSSWAFLGTVVSKNHLPWNACGLLRTFLLPWGISIVTILGHARGSAPTASLTLPPSLIPPGRPPGPAQALHIVHNHLRLIFKIQNTILKTHPTVTSYSVAGIPCTPLRMQFHTVAVNVPGRDRPRRVTLKSLTVLAKLSMDLSKLSPSPTPNHIRICTTASGSSDGLSGWWCVVCAGLLPGGIHSDRRNFSVLLA